MKLLFKLFILLYRKLNICISRLKSGIQSIAKYWMLGFSLEKVSRRYVGAILIFTIILTGNAYPVNYSNYELKKPYKPKPFMQKPIQFFPQEKTQPAEQVQETRPTTAPVVTDPGNNVNSGADFRIDWSSVPGATFYDLQLESDPSFNNAHTQGTNCTNSSFRKDVTTQTTYYFRVRARNNDGSGPWSNVVDMTVLPAAPPEPPTTPPVLSASAATVLSDQTYTISWTAPPRADWYFLIESQSPAFDDLGGTGINTAANSYSTHHEVTKPTTYYYRVNATNRTGVRTDWSNTVSVTINPRASQSGQPTTAPVVTDPGNSVNSGTDFRIDWSSVPGATFYDLQLESDPSFNNAHTQGTNCTNSSFRKDVTTQTTYYFRVRARNNDGSGPWSNVVDMTVLPAAPPEPPTTPPVLSASAATVLSDQTYTISWTAPPRADWYFLIESQSPAFDDLGGTGINTAANSYSTHHEVTKPTTYYYHANATNQTGVRTGWSNTVSVTINPR